MLRLPNPMRQIDAIRNLGLIDGAMLVGVLWYMGEKIRPFSRVRMGY